MPTFLWSGKDAEGRPRSERLEAENAQAAKAILAGRGWSELELVKDEVAYAASLQIEAKPPDWVVDQDDKELEEDWKDEFEKQNTPDQEAAFFKGQNPPGLLAQTWTSLKESRWNILAFGALLAFGIYRHKTWLIVIGAVGVGVLVLLMPAVHLVFFFFSRSSREYSRLNKAKVWGRWNEVLDCVERLRQTDRLTGAAVPELELGRCRAQALAALGRFDEGLAEFQKFEHAPKVERWLYLSFLAGVYDEARQFEKGLELRRQAAAEKPDTAAVWIDVAYAAVRGLNRPAEAREALARAERLEVPGLGKPYLFFLRGIILWREHQPAQAREQLERALVGFQPMAHNDLVEGLLLLTKAYLCAVHTELGDFSKAKPLFREVEKFLLAHHEEELLDACPRAR